MGRTDTSFSLGWGNKEGAWASAETTPSEKSVAYAYQRALKRGMRLLGKHAYIMDVRSSYNDSFSALGGRVNVPVCGRINMLMSTP